MLKEAQWTNRMCTRGLSDAMMMINTAMQLTHTPHTTHEHKKCGGSRCAGAFCFISVADSWQGDFVTVGMLFVDEI